MTGGGVSDNTDKSESGPSTLHPALLHSLKHPKMIETDSILIERKRPKQKGNGPTEVKKIRIERNNLVSKGKFAHKFNFL